MRPNTRLLRRLATGLCAGLALAAQAQTAAPRAAAADPPKPARAAKAPAIAGSAPAAKPESFAIGPAPSWVVPATETPGARVDAAAMHYRVIDRQLRIDGASAWDYFHVVRVVDSAAGLATVAQIALEFDPGYQTFTLHRLAVVRQGKAISQLERGRIQLLQRETQLERQIYDGRVTMSVVLEDVRVGDEVDFAYSIRGSNPVFDGKFVGSEIMASHRGPVANYQVRLLAPEARRIAHRIGPSDVGVESKVVSGVRETVFRRQSVAQFSPEPGAPASVVLAQQVEFSEFADWGAVARWGAALFDAPAASPEVDALAAQLRAQHGERQGQLLAALDFVQREVRYFGTEIGAGSHRPAPPQQVLSQRFGDCKDKVALLLALLRRLDFQATPVLVSAYLHGQIRRALASPLAFDHVIVRIDFDNTAYWFDATRSHQTGKLPGRQALDFRAGLDLAPGVTALSELPNGFDAERQVVEDTIRFERISADPVLESRITLRGVLAEVYREYLATRGAEALQTAVIAPYLRPYPRLESAGALQVVDGTDDGALTLAQRMRIPGFWRFPEERALVADVVHWATLEVLAHPGSQSRRDPLAYALPGVYRHTIAMEFPEDIVSRPVRRQASESDAHFEWSGYFEAEGQRAVYRSVLRLGVEQVEPQAWAAYSAKLSKLSPQLAPGASLPAATPASVERMRKEVDAIVEAAAPRSRQPRTTAQSEALTRLSALSFQLGSGRLPPALQGQALAARGVQFDNLGRLDDARRDFDAALALTPDDARALNAAAVNAFLLGDFARSIELSDRVLQRNSRDGEARYARGVARYFQKNYAAAQADLTDVLSDEAAVRRGYGLLWLSLAARRSGGEQQQGSALASRLGDAQLPSAWPRPLVDLALGKTTEDAVLEAARRSNAPREQLCEAHFFIGESYSIRGDRARAIEHWRKALETGVVEYLEYGAARLRSSEASGG